MLDLHCWAYSLPISNSTSLIIVEVDDLAHEVAEGRLGLGDEGQGAAQVEGGEADAGGEDAIDGALAKA